MDNLVKKYRALILLGAGVDHESDALDDSWERVAYNMTTGVAPNKDLPYDTQLPDDLFEATLIALDSARTNVGHTE